MKRKAYFDILYSFLITCYFVAYLHFQAYLYKILLPDQGLSFARMDSEIMGLYLADWLLAVGFGVILGLPNFLLRSKNANGFTLDWAELMIKGLPALCLSTHFLFMEYMNIFSIPLLAAFVKFHLYVLARVWMGSVIISSLGVRESPSS